jgi:hypothetical protein
MTTPDSPTATRQPTEVSVSETYRALSLVLSAIHVAALGVVMWGLIAGFPFTKALLACAAVSLAIIGHCLFMPADRKLVLNNRVGLAVVLLAAAIGAPLALGIVGLGVGGLIWLVTGVQAVRALWLYPRSTPRLTLLKVLPILIALGAWMYATPWIAGGPPCLHLGLNVVVAAAVVKVCSRRCGWIGGLLIGAACAIVVVTATTTAWAAFYTAPPPLSFAISTEPGIAIAVVCGALIGAFSRVKLKTLGLSRPVKLNKIELDHKASAAVRGLMKRLQKREALVVREMADGKRSGELDDGKAVPVLIEALGSKDLHVRFSAAEVLGRIGIAAAPAISTLKRMVGSDPQPGDRPGEALARMGAGGVAALIELLKSEEPTKRAGAAQALRRAGPDCTAAAEALANSLDDADAAVRQHAAASLGELGVSSDPVIAALNGASRRPFVVGASCRTQGVGTAHRRARPAWMSEQNGGPRWPLLGGLWAALGFAGCAKEW